MTTEELTNQIRGLLETNEAAEFLPIIRTATFEEAGVRYNDGLVIRLADGSDYHLTVTRGE